MFYKVYEHPCTSVKHCTKSILILSLNKLASYSVLLAYTCTAIMEKGKILHMNCRHRKPLQTTYVLILELILEILVIKLKFRSRMQSIVNP